MEQHDLDITINDVNVSRLELELLFDEQPILSIFNDDNITLEVYNEHYI